MVSEGLNVSVQESAFDYKLDNTKINAKYVYAPYSSVSDSLVKVSSEEVKKYVENHPKEFKREASRSLKYVTFAITPSKEDEVETKKQVASFINDREEYNTATKSKGMVKGFKNATDLKSFFEVNKSDIAFNDNYFFNNELPKDSIWKSVEVNQVVGPYKENGFFKLSKVLEITKLPDSVKSSHIIVPFAGTIRATTTRTKEEAKKMIDSLFTIVSKNPKQFSVIAEKINVDATKTKGGEIGWVTKKSAFSPYFDRDFANYIFKNKKGNTGVVLSKFGYHIIRIDDQKNFEKAYKVSSFGRVIEPSEATENNIFEQAETLALRLAEGKKIEEAGKEKNYLVQNAENLRILDEQVPGIGNQRQIINWAYKDDTKVGDSKRFDIEYSGKRGYVVVELSQKTDDDEVAITGDILNKVTPILKNEKKAKILAKKISGNTLEEIAKSLNTNIRIVSGVTFANPLLSGVGNEPKVVGAMSGIPTEKISKAIDGNKGVFVVKVTKRTDAVKLDNYDSYTKKRKKGLNGRLNNVYDVLKEKADIVDQRGKFF